VNENGLVPEALICPRDL